MIKNISFFILIICIKMNSQNIVYDSTLYNVQQLENNFSLPSHGSHKIPEEINIYFLEGELIETNFSFSENHRSAIRYYGYSLINGFRLYLFSEQIPVNYDPNPGGLIQGFLVVANNKIPEWYIKIYEHEMDSISFLKSYFYENYLIMIRFYDPSYDLVYDRNMDDENSLSYVVIEFDKKSGINLLHEKEGKYIAQKFLPKIFQ